MRTDLGRIGERRAIERWTRALPSGSDVLVGPGDDAAVVRLRGAQSDLVMKSDPVIENVHFTAADAPESVGHKAAGRVLSDLAAMGASPAWLLVNFSAPASTPIARADRAMRGLRRLASRFGAAVVGGDTSAGPAFALNVFAAGLVPRNKAVTRNGARPGDVLCVTGRLGGSMNSGRHLTFVPRVREGIFLRKWATSMIDISDGLATDLRHVADASGVGARVQADRIPVSIAARRIRDGRSPLLHGICDGEDFELLFTVKARRRHAFMSAWRRAFRTPCTLIGTITRSPGRIEYIGTDNRVLRPPVAGFEHFHGARRK